MSKLNNFLVFLITAMFLTSCIPPSSVTKEDVQLSPQKSREEVIDLMVDSPMIEDGLTIVDPENSGVKREMIEIEGYQKGVKFKDSNWEDFPISINFNMIPLRKFFELLSGLTKINFIVGEEIKGDLTIKLTNVSWIEVFEMVLREKNLLHDVNPSGTVITVHTYDFIAQQSKDYESALTSKIQVINSLSGLETKTTAIFKLNYAKPNVLAEQLKSVIATLEAGGERGSVEQRATFVIDSRTNSLIVQATPSDISWIKTTIDSLDKPTKQVMVEVYIVEASDGFEQALGSRISLFHNGADNNDLDRLSISGSGGTPPTALGEITTAAAGGSLASNTIAGATGGIVGVFAGNSTDLRIELEAMQTESLIKIVSNPKLFIIDNETATIEDGQEIPYQLAAQAGATPTTSFKTAALSLRVTPSIIPDGNVYLDIEVNKDSPLTGSSPPPISTKNIKTKLLIQDGGVAMIGGIVKSSESTAEEGVPFFKDIPYLGNLFKSKSDSDSKNTLYIFIAPKVL